MSFKFEDIDDEIYMKLAEKAGGKDYIWVTPKELPPNFPLVDQSPQACCLSYRYKKWAEKIKNFEVYDDDVWIVTYPKSGTTWSQEMIYLLKNNLDYEKASKSKLAERFPFLEFESVIDVDLPFSSFELARDQLRPRLIKTHLPAQLLPDQIWTVNPKIIYVFRNPKDVAVSFFHHYTTLHSYVGEINEFVDCFVNEFILWNPFHAHISSFLRLDQIKPNILVSTYEAMKKDLPKEIRRSAMFLGVEINEENILKLADHLSFSSMKKNSSVNFEVESKSQLLKINRTNEKNDNMHFIRKGEVGGWKKDLTPAMAKKIDDWSNEKIMEDKLLQKYFNCNI